MSKILQTLIVSVALALPALFAAHRIHASIDHLRPPAATVTVDHVALAKAAFALAEANRPVSAAPETIPAPKPAPPADGFFTPPASGAAPTSRCACSGPASCTCPKGECACAACAWTWDLRAFEAAKTQRRQLPVVVWVGQPAPPLMGMLSFSADDYADTPRPGAVVLRPDGGDLIVVKRFAGTPSGDDLRAALNPARQVPAAPAPVFYPPAPAFLPSFGGGRSCRG